MPTSSKEKLPCTHCGRKESYHYAKTWQRSSDSLRRDGYPTSFVNCPGFKETTCRRNKNSTRTYDGFERREMQHIESILNEILKNTPYTKHKEEETHFIERRNQKK